MKRTHATILIAVVGVLALCGMVVVSLGAWFFASAFEAQAATEPTAVRSFDEVRQRFKEGPILDIVDRHTARVRRPAPAAPAAVRLQHLQIMAWDPDDERMVHVTLPFWLLRMKAGPIDFAAHVRISEGPARITVEELERYGPALLIDHEERGRDRLLIWTE
jgi:hypothetical protein